MTSISMLRVGMGMNGQKPRKPTQLLSWICCFGDVLFSTMANKFLETYDIFQISF